MDHQDNRLPGGWSPEGRSHEGQSHDGRATGRPQDRVEEGHPVISAARARQAETVGALRYVLGVSIGLAITVFAVACLITVVIPH